MSAKLISDLNYWAGPVPGSLGVFFDRSRRRTAVVVESGGVAAWFQYLSVLADGVAADLRLDKHLPENQMEFGYWVVLLTLVVLLSHDHCLLEALLLHNHILLEMFPI